MDGWMGGLVVVGWVGEREREREDVSLPHDLAHFSRSDSKALFSFLNLYTATPEDYV